MEWSTELIGKPAHRVTRFQGAGRLKAPWLDDAVLRLTPFDVVNLSLHFCRGLNGVAFRFFPHAEPPLWAAYQISRSEESPKPTQWRLLTTDNGSYARSMAGTFDVRHQGQELVMARGGQFLMSVPFPGPPTEVDVTGQFRLRGLTMHRSEAIPIPDGPRRQQLVDRQAAELPWTASDSSGSHCIRHPDGSVSLNVTAGASDAAIHLPWKWSRATKPQEGSAGLCEVIAQLQSADEGTGFFLGDVKGNPLCRWEFIRHAKDDALALSPRPTGQNLVADSFSIRNGPIPILAEPIWLKWTLALDKIHLQLSGDGHHWGTFVGDLDRPKSRSIGSFGLYATPGESERSIRLRHIQVRELSGLWAIVQDDLRMRLNQMPVDESTDIASWIQRVESNLPNEVVADRWFMANSVQLLHQPQSKDLGRAVLAQLVDRVVKSNFSLSQKFDFLDDVSAITDRTDEDAATFIARSYEESARQSLDMNALPSGTLLRGAILGAPAWTRNPFQSAYERRQSHDILQAVYGQRWNIAWNLARSASFWNSPPHPDAHPTERGVELLRHARWAEALAVEFSPQLDDGAASVMPPNLRHPLVLTVNKASYAARADLQSALLGSNFDEACRITMSLNPNHDQDLLPSSDDPLGFVSLSSFVRTARQLYPEFARIMADRYQAHGEIRLRTAINQHDRLAVDAVTRQFMGTAAARDAHVWLGDQHLALRQFELAEQCYLDAMTDGEETDRDRIESRLILTRARSGRWPRSDVEQALDALRVDPVTFNTFTLSNADFRQLILNLVEQRKEPRLTSHALRENPQIIEPGAYTLVPRVALDGDVGADPGRWEYRLVDAIGRQLAVATDPQRLFISNRFQLAAFSKDGTRLLWTRGLGEEQADTHVMPFTPMKAMPAGDRVFARRLTKGGAELACLDSATGDVVWRQRPVHGMISDPVIWNGRLFALMATRSEDDLLQVAATWFDDLTGEIESTRILFALREPIERWCAGQLSISERRAVCTVAGTTACFDWRGELIWLQQQLFLRRPVDELADDFRVYPPVLDEKRVIVSQPGVREIRCFDLETGQTNWNRPIPDLRGILGVTSTRVVVDTPRGVTCISRQTGEPVWNVPMAPRLEAVWIGDSTCTVAQRINQSDGPPNILLSWFNVETGKRLGQSLIGVTTADELLMGPLFSCGGKFFTFAGTSSKTGQRTLFEVSPIGDASPAGDDRKNTNPQ